MFPKGTIYKSGRSKVPGEFVLRPKLLIKFLYHAARVTGAGFISFAIVGLIFTYYPLLQQEFNYTFHRPKENIDAGFIPSSNAKNLGLDPYFSIYIPKIDAKARIIPNVDTGKPQIYDAALKEGVAHARGTNFPGGGHLIYLFSHSTDSPMNVARYNAVFYLAGKLEKGDKITVYFLDKEYDYEVEEKVVTSPKDVSWLTDNNSGEYLILQTCDPPGTSWKRLLVIARLVK